MRDKERFMRRVKTQGEKFTYTKAYAELALNFKRVTGRDPITKEIMSLISIADLITSEIKPEPISAEIQEKDDGEYSAYIFFVRLSREVEKWFRDNIGFVLEMVEVIAL